MAKYHFDPELEQLLVSMKDRPELGGDFDFQKSWKQISNIGGFADTSSVNHTWRDHLEFYLWDFSHQMLKPVASFAVFVFLVAGGWVGVVNASMGTLPGDPLYNVKLGMEKAQLALATSDSQRASLRTEFTSRRLDEMVALAAASSTPSNQAQFAMAVDRAKQDVSDISASLADDGKTTPQTTELAKAVGRKADVYVNTVETSNPALSKDVQKKVQEVKDILDKTKNQAVEVIITAHEQTQTDVSTHDVQVEFEKEFAHAVTVASSADSEKLKQASDLEKQGAYRRAFEVLKEIEAAHAVAE